MRSNAGFTLLELIVVLGIVALGYAAVGVNFSAGNDAMELKAAARDLSSGLRYVRSQAMLLHTSATLDFNLSNNSYLLTGQVKIYTLPENIDVTINTAKDELHDGTAHLRFFPDGSSIGGRITLEKKSLVQEININWLTGHVTLAE